MIIDIAAFSGELPRLIPRLLPNSAAQEAYNTKLERGDLVPIRNALFRHNFGIGVASFYKHRDQWLGFDVVADVARAPSNENRLYMTGFKKPQLWASGTFYDLAVPRPRGKPLVSIEGELDPELSSTIVYAYTWVTKFDEESEPSPLSNETLWSPGQTVKVSGFSVPSPGSRIDRIRVYRSQTSALGETQLYFIAERKASSGTLTDDDLSISEPLPSTNYNPPPDNLSGIINLPNGMMAAFVEKRIYFCEPYIPHAWPETYVLTVDYPIVGLGAFGNSIVIMTEGNPYVASGTAPENMVLEKLELNLPCISSRGIVDLGYSVAYPSHDGLVVVSSQGANVVTRQLMTRDQWLQMNPYSLVAGQFSGRYMASYAYTDEQEVEQRGIIVIDLTGEKPFIVRSNDSADAMHYDIENGALYLLRNGSQVYEWDAISQPYGDQRWRSKRFELGTLTNFGAILIEGDDQTTELQRKTMQEEADARLAENVEAIENNRVGGAFGESGFGTLPFAGTLLNDIEDYQPTVAVTVYADGRPVTAVTGMNTPVRLPSGFLAKRWEVEVNGNIQITRIALASSPYELSGGG